MFLKNRNISSKTKRSKVTDYAALNNKDMHGQFSESQLLTASVDDKLLMLHKWRKGYHAHEKKVQNHVNKKKCDRLCSLKHCM